MFATLRATSCTCAKVRPNPSLERAGVGPLSSNVRRIYLKPADPITRIVQNDIRPLLRARGLGCCWFPGHLVTVGWEAGGGRWRSAGSLRGSSSWRRRCWVRCSVGVRIQQGSALSSNARHCRSLRAQSMAASGGRSLVGLYDHEICKAEDGGMCLQLHRQRLASSPGLWCGAACHDDRA